MRKRLVVLFLLAVVGSVTFAWLRMSSRQSAPSPLTISFSEREPGLSYRAAGFYVTNCGHRTVMLYKVQVQVAQEEGWKTLSDKQVTFSQVLEAGVSPQAMFSSELKVGEHRKIVVEWPEEKPWRLCLFYFREQKGLGSLTAKARYAWRTRSMSHWRGSMFGDLDQIISKNVTR